jgi:phosphopantothenoylcysteine decarboxylase/phosphopantothenate--cysteine ligase
MHAKDEVVVLGVTGSIAAYKSAEIVTRLIRLGYSVQVIMTESAIQFVSPLTFQTLSKNSVITSLFTPNLQCEVEHIALVDKCKLLLIAPATANIISKIAHGIADDFLSTFAVAYNQQILIAPAMNHHMWNNSIIQENVKKLQQRGVSFVLPEYGRLACGVEAQGRLAEIKNIIDAVEIIIHKPKSLTGKTVVITAGATREMIDPVRYISNPASGKTGYALAKSAKKFGAKVILISGYATIDVPWGIDEYYKAGSAKEMKEKVMECMHSADIFISAAAVSDYTPEKVYNQKLKKTDKEEIILRLKTTDDILEGVSKKYKDHRILVGFAAETENVVENAKAKLDKKQLDIIVANDVSRKDIGFGSDKNEVIIITRYGSIEELPCITKQEIADRLMMNIVDMINDSSGE